MLPNFHNRQFAMIHTPTISSFLLYWLLSLHLVFVIVVGIDSNVTDIYDICQNRNHAVGEWVYDNFSTKSFFCCPYNLFLDGVVLDSSKPNCSMDRRFGFWMPREPYFTGNDSALQLVAPNSCQYDQHTSRVKVNPIQKYRWTPSFCSLLEWDAKKFCNLLGNRKILVIGDSTSYQSAATLMNMITMGYGGCAERIYLTVSDRLEANVFKSWEIIKPDITIVSTGAHHHSREDMHKVWSEFTQKYHIVRQHNPAVNSTFVWKTQNPGHVGCMQHSEPLKLFRRNFTMDRFQWNLHPVFDAISVKYARSLGFKILDMSPLYLRADAHVGHYEKYAGVDVDDCLHFSLPGPVDLFSVLLYNMFVTGEL